MEQDEVPAEHEQDQQITDLNDLWLVCFTGRKECQYWWDRFFLTREDFRHVYVCQYQVDTRRWILLDWRTGICDVIAFTHDELEHILGHLRQNHGTAVVVKRRKVEREIHYRIPFIYCVQAVMQVIGLTTRWTYTPYQLYKRLMKEGCEELFNYRSHEDGQQQQTQVRSERGRNQRPDSQAASA